MDILLFIVLACVLMYQSGRITKVEALLKIKGKSVVSDNPVVTSVASPAPASPVAVSSAPEPATPAESGEEVSGRILGRIGIGAVIVGVAFFLKYAFDNDWVGPAGRVAIGIVIGIAVIVIGQTLRKKYLRYSDVLMGGGLAILYLSIYSSYGFYQLVDPMTAFLGMACVTALGVVISIMNATETLFGIALIGGFIGPCLIGESQLGPWIIFTYITILNAGVLGILLYKKWARLIVIGLFGTWLLFGAWFSGSYTDALLVPTLLFILIQFLIFTASSVVRIIVEKVQAFEIDYIVLTATAIGFAAMCYNLLMPQYKDYVAMGAVLVACFYGAVALIAYKENPKDRSLNIFLPGLAVAFLTVAVPIEFSGQWIAAWWFVEALVLYIVASTSSSRGFQIMGVVVYILGLINLFFYITNYIPPQDYVIFFNGPFVMLVMAIATAYVIAFMYHRYGSTSAGVRERGLAVFVVMANILTLYALTSQVALYYSLQINAMPGGSVMSFNLQNSSNTAVSILWTLYAALLIVIGFAKRYAPARRMGLILFIITAFKVVLDVWNLGQLYRIISFISFGIIALAASFLYAKYKNRLKDII